MIAQAAKYAAHQLGALPTYHRLRNRRTLTVLMFHRVLPAAECERSQADPDWTVTTELFEATLLFLRRHYNLVGLGDVLAARAHRAPLPPRALLITFDDGWRDNRDYAWPILRRHGAPAVVFVASDAIEGTSVCWWQEVLLWALRSGRTSVGELSRDLPLSAAGNGADVAPELRLLLRFAGLDPARRDELLQGAARELEQRQQHPHMLDAASLRALAAAGAEIGVHGAAHLPLTSLADPADDLATARRHIASHIGKSESAALSFPHGRYDARVVGIARQLGFALLFTSDAVINSCPGGFLESDLVGRIPVFAHHVSRRGDGLASERLATWLFLRSYKT